MGQGTPHEPGERRDEGSAATRWWATAVLTALLVGATLAGVEAAHHARRFDWAGLEPSRWDRALVVALLLSKTLALLAPPLLASGWLARRGRRRAASTLLGASAALVCAVLFVDLRVERVTGVGLGAYMSFVGDRNPLEMVGAQALARPVAEGVFTVSLAVLCLLLLAARAAPLLERRLGGGPRRAAAATTCVFGALLVGPLLLARTGGEPLLLARHLAAFPVRLPVWRPVGDAARGGFVPLLNVELARSFGERYGPGLRLARAPQDGVALRPPGELPDVLVLVVESLRHDAVDARWMPRLSAWADERALRFEQHFSSGNASHNGLFALLHGRSPLVYAPHLAAGLPAQLTHTLRAGGYEARCISSSHFDWQGMDAFISPLNFDRLELEEEGRWHERDLRTLARCGALLRAEGPPRFLLGFLMATHFDYAYPPEYERFLPVAAPGETGFLDLWKVATPSAGFIAAWQNRYRNALAFLDDAIADLLEDVDLSRTLVVITGDHGESFFDDGRWLHAGRLSDAQCRVPFLLAGPGVPPGRRSDASTHLDLTPTLLSRAAGAPLALEHQHGRDLLDPAAAEVPTVLVSAAQLEVALVRPTGRLHIGVDAPRRAALSLGFLTTAGAFAPEAALTPHEAEDWFRAVERALRHIAAPPAERERR